MDCVSSGFTCATGYLEKCLFCWSRCFSPRDERSSTLVGSRLYATDAWPSILELSFISCLDTFLAREL
jgi:hypothetical protein